MSESISRVLTSFLSALSVTVALGLAFALDMEKPFWAGFAALVVSLSTVGQSLEKGLLRMAGTVAGAVIAMSLLSLFGDARWTLMLSVGAMLVILELCMEMSRYSSYFYYTTALVILLVVAQSHGEAPFFVAASRVEENMLGIAVYTVCALLLWPRSSLDSLHATVFSLVSWPARLWRSGTGGAFPASEYKEALDAVDKASGLLPAARLESYEVRRDLVQWEDLIRLCGVLLRLQRDLALDKGGDPPPATLTPALEALESWRPGAGGADIPTVVDAKEEGWERMLSLCGEIRELLEMLLGGRTGHVSRHVSTAAPGIAFPLPFLLFQVGKLLFLICFVTGVWIFFDPPGDARTMFAEICIMLGLVSFLTGRFTPVILVVSFGTGIVLSAVLEFFILPDLTGFSSLAPVLFGVTFPVCWLFYLPAQGLERMGILMPSFLITGLNGESWSAHSYLASGTTLCCCVLVMAWVFYLMQGTGPERKYAALYRSFVRSMDRLERGEMTWNLWDLARLRYVPEELFKLSLQIKEEKLGLSSRCLTELALACLRAARQNDPERRAVEFRICRERAASIDWKKLDIWKF